MPRSAAEQRLINALGYQRAIKFAALSEMTLTEAVEWIDMLAADRGVSFRRVCETLDVPDRGQVAKPPVF